MTRTVMRALLDMGPEGWVFANTCFKGWGLMVAFKALDTKIGAFTPQQMEARYSVMVAAARVLREFMKDPAHPSRVDRFNDFYRRCRS